MTPARFYCHLWLLKSFLTHFRWERGRRAVKKQIKPHKRKAERQRRRNEERQILTTCCPMTCLPCPSWSLSWASSWSHIACYRPINSLEKYWILLKLWWKVGLASELGNDWWSFTICEVVCKCMWNVLNGPWFSFKQKSSCISIQQVTNLLVSIDKISTSNCQQS